MTARQIVAGEQMEGPYSARFPSVQSGTNPASASPPATGSLAGWVDREFPLGQQKRTPDPWYIEAPELPPTAKARAELLSVRSWPVRLIVQAHRRLVRVVHNAPNETTVGRPPPG